MGAVPCQRATPRAAARSHTTCLYPTAGGKKGPCRSGVGDIIFLTMWKRKIGCNYKNKNPQNGFLCHCQVQH